MANGLLVSDRGVATVQGAWLEGDRAGLLTVGAKLLAGQGLSLLLKQGIQGALGQATRRCTGEVFEGSDAHGKSRAGIAEVRRAMILPHSALISRTCRSCSGVN